MIAAATFLGAIICMVDNTTVELQVTSELSSSNNNHHHHHHRRHHRCDRGLLVFIAYAFDAVLDGIVFVFLLA